MIGSSEEPKTGEGVLALPEEPPPFHKVTCGNCRNTINVPVARRARAQPYSKDSIVFVRDAEGVAWSPVLLEDGWFKQRRVF